VISVRGDVSSGRDDFAGVFVAMSVRRGGVRGVRGDVTERRAPIGGALRASRSRAHVVGLGSHVDKSQGHVDGRGVHDVRSAFAGVIAFGDDVVPLGEGVIGGYQGERGGCVVVGEVGSRVRADRERDPRGLHAPESKGDVEKPPGHVESRSGHVDRSRVHVEGERGLGMGSAPHAVTGEGRDVRSRWHAQNKGSGVATLATRLVEAAPVASMERERQAKLERERGLGSARLREKTDRQLRVLVRAKGQASEDREVVRGEGLTVVDLGKARSQHSNA
jgi:hypothetical protein